jgi:hypothetical protein
VPAHGKYALFTSLNFKLNPELDNQLIFISRRRKLWLQNAGMDESDIRVDLRMCEHHFEDEAYNCKGKLKKNAAPVINISKVRYVEAIVC